MSVIALRGWLPGLVLALGSGVGSWLAVSQGQQAQELRMQQLSDDVASLRRAVRALPAPASVMPPGGNAAGIPPSLEAGAARPTSEDLDAIAARMVTLLKQSGALAEGPRPAEPPAPPPPLTPEQHAAATRADVLVERVVSSGHMTAEDVRDIRRELSQLGGRAEAEALRRRIVVAINQNRLIPSDDAEGLP
ncbi:hypothetical protein JY651_14045 [Pyxidicoccus parkwayensis]|uniref:Uncharacterized protein n=1 Tax=Pyxidicoccus parkwayensis TaxID=2813578 RepID=A0ABX7P676_9BACT|nr:hypothetical protein [Pyxidicoccus parkwaysis]QSQ25973.1 hypothetical protein JY651_14045 [Pyxidicoccus parkwaysis]